MRHFKHPSGDNLNKGVMVVMNGFRLYQVVVVLSSMATISVGCASSRDRGCRDGSCRVSSSAESVPPRRNEMLQTHAAEDTPRGKIQQTCPVTSEKLGSMGPPIPVMVAGKTIQVCCQSCVTAVKKNPGKYLKIVDNEVDNEIGGADAPAPRREASYEPPADPGRDSESLAGHHH